MTQKNRRRSPGSILSKFLKVIFLALLIVLLLGAGSLGIAVLNIVQDAPDISTENINSMLTENSVIVDPSGRQLELIQTEEFRRIIEIDEMPDHLKKAVISVEDERFYSNMGVDPQGIVKSAIDNFRAGDIVRGGSTITQQLVKLMYLSDEQTIERKLKEAYLAVQLTEAMPKDKILEAYLNRIFLGQGAYGVEAAAQIYFSKHAKDLTIGESAALASIINSPSNNALYKTIAPSQVEEGDRVVGEILIENEKYIAVYNPDQEERRQYVLSNMLEQGMITQEEHDAALQEDMFVALDPPERKTEEVSSYFTDFVKQQVVQELMDQLGYSREEAVDKLYNGGLVITATIDVDMQQKLDMLYDEFTELLLSGDYLNWSEPGFIRWNQTDSGNILNANNNIAYFHKDNLLTEDNRAYLSEGSYRIENGLHIDSDKMVLRNNTIDIADVWTRSEENNLVTHRVGGYEFDEGDVSENEEGVITISQRFLDENPDFYEINEEGSLLISTDYFSYDEIGVLQPQVTTVIMDQTTGQIKAMRGGRGTTGSSILNRATQSPRQPGSTMKPLATYLPALDNGYTAATPIDDVPYYREEDGQRWPTNWDFRYQGIVSLRTSIIGSMNVNAVRTLEDVGLQTSQSYLQKMHLIDPIHPENDNFVTRDEDPYANDENLAAMGLGGMVHGFTNLELTSAYNSIANDGTYVEPVSFSKIEDTRGNLILDNQPERTEVVSPQTAFIMKDILRNLTDASVIQTVKIDGIDTAGKTGTSGTTTRNIDSWFVGFTPYLTAGVWIGSDDPNNVFIDEVSSYAVRFWGIVMRSMHEGYEDKTFDIPEGIVEAQVCTQSGKKPTSLCYADPRGTVRTEYFVRGTEPVEECDAHVSARVDRSTNRLATQFCPENLVVNRVFVKRPKPYVPSENEGILPDDWAYTLPTTYCHVHTQPAQTEPPETEPAETEETTEPDTDTPQTDPPQTEPPQTDPPQTDPPQTDPPADGDE
ncbi:MAG: transglycosylase domain-containing protein [Peptoniphilaceae bacterium]|jgi:penicillin-binding protein 1A